MRQLANDVLITALAVAEDAAHGIFETHDIWYAPVNDYEQVEADPQVINNGVVMHVDHPKAGPVRLMTHPVRYDGQAPALRRMPPGLGEHTREVLAQARLCPLSERRFRKRNQSREQCRVSPRCLRPAQHPSA